jgi:flagellar biosynthesis/type III secretory pathway chaperone
MENDNEVLKHIERLTGEEEHLYSKGELTDEEIKKLHKMKVELDQCWDLLNQRRALREAGKNPDNAKMRPPGIVENYEQ